MFSSKQNYSGHHPIAKKQAEKKPFILQRQGLNKPPVQNQSKKFKLEVGFSAFIPNVLNAPVHKYNKAWKEEPSPFSSKLFASDDRSYKESGSSRIFQKGTIEFVNTDVVNRLTYKSIGVSEQADPITKIISQTPIHYGSDTGGRYITRITGIKNIKKKYAKDNGSVTKIYRDGKKGFNFKGQASYPFSDLAPNIDFNVNTLIHLFKPDGKNFYALISLYGIRDNFPAYEGYVQYNGKKHFFYSYEVDKNDGPGLINLNTSTTLSRIKILKL